MRLALDTNRYRDLVDGVPEARETVYDSMEVVIPFAVLGELHHGFRYGTRRAENEAILQSLLSQPIVRVRYPDADTLSIWADLAADLQRRGFKLPHNDLWIAAICVQHGLHLYTRDSHFDRLPQVMRV